MAWEGAKSASRIWRDAYGLEGLGWWIFEGERARPVAISEPRRGRRAELLDSLPPGTSRMLSLRLVVGSTV
jgi:hypothetical protein